MSETPKVIDFVKPKYHTEYKRKRRAAGLCAWCGIPAKKTYCDKHSEVMRKRAVKIRAKRLADGLCSKCSSRAEIGHSLCQSHLKHLSLKRTEIKRRAVEMLGGACKDCGLRTEFLDVYDFDHLPGTGKVAHISLMRLRWEYVEAELKKCELVCANCHRIRTAKRFVE